MLGIEEDGTTLDDIQSQRKRFMPVLHAQQADLLSELPTSLKTALVDNESPFSAK